MYDIIAIERFFKVDSNFCYILFEYTDYARKIDKTECISKKPHPISAFAHYTPTGDYTVFQPYLTNFARKMDFL